MKRANGIILVYDPLEEEDSLENDLRFWKNEIKANCSINLKEYLWIVGVFKTETFNSKNHNDLIKKVFQEDTPDDKHIQIIRPKDFEDIQVYNNYIKIRNYLLTLQIT